MEMTERKIIVLAHNIRSTHNIGSIFRTCDGFGVEKLLISGYSPYPLSENDTRLPHLSKKISGQINKTALGAENIISWEKLDDPLDYLTSLKSNGYTILGLEQQDTSKKLNRYQGPEKIVLILGEEVFGIPKVLLDSCDEVVEIPMLGSKESFNVSVACGIALYQLRYF